jgi:hypothetical protein
MGAAQAAEGLEFARAADELGRSAQNARVALERRGAREPIEVCATVAKPLHCDAGAARTVEMLDARGAFIRSARTQRQRGRKAESGVLFVERAVIVGKAREEIQRSAVAEEAGGDTHSPGTLPILDAAEPFRVSADADSLRGDARSTFAIHAALAVEAVERPTVANLLRQNARAEGALVVAETILRVVGTGGAKKGIESATRGFLALRRAVGVVDA